ncbi:MAG: hypothetical protein ACJ8GW_15460 [Massilia sp.]
MNVVFAVSLLLCAGSAHAAVSEASMQGRVLSVSARPPDSGYILTFVRVQLVQHGRRQPTALFIPYMSSEQYLPVVAKECKFVVHLEKFGDGLVMGSSLPKTPLNVVDNFDCAK